MEAEAGVAPPVVDVLCTGGSCFVWNHQCATALRQQHRIVGALVGSLPQHQQTDQKDRGSLPLMLLPEEVSLALKKGWIRLIDDSVPYELREEDVLAYKKRQAELKETTERIRKERRAQEIGHWTKQAKSKRSKKKEKSEKETSPREEATPDTVNKSEQDVDTEEETPSNGVKETKPHADTIPLEIRGSDLPWRRSEREISWENWRKTIFPKGGEKEQMREIVYEDLWHKGYYISSAAKFGGDFLLYDGDPQLEHAIYIVLVMGWDEAVSPLDIIAFGRLASGVNKTAILSSVSSSPSENKVTYTKFAWRGVT